MRSIIAKNQTVHIAEKEKPIIQSSYLLIKTLYSAISPGTETSLIESSTNGTRSLGYSAMGVIEECGVDVADQFKVGDLVSCYGAPYTSHSEYLLVPETLCAKVPDNVSPQAAALGGIGAIAIHGLRVPKIEFGETVVVVGLGLLGQMIAQIAQAAACEVLAYDISEERVAMVKDMDIQSFYQREVLEAAIAETTDGQGADVVLLCAGGKKSPLTSQSLYWIRQQGKVVIVGDIEPDFPREPMFKKEAQILISRAGGPGRYDSTYEKEAIDYPFGYVRWTEGRNIAEYLRLVARNKIDVTSFVTDGIAFNEAPSIYEQLTNKESTTLTKIIHYDS